MRGAALATDGGDYIAPISGVAGAAVGGFFLWLAQRLTGKAAVERVIHEGFKDVIAELRAQLQAERDEAKREREAYTAEMIRERAENAAETGRLRGEVQRLTSAVRLLRDIMRDRGIPLPDTLSEFNQDDPG